MNTTQTAIAARRTSGREPPPVLTAKDVARLFGVHVRSIHRWHREGKLPAPLPFGTRVPRWRRDDVLALVTGGSHAQ